MDRSRGFGDAFVLLEKESDQDDRGADNPVGEDFDRTWGNTVADGEQTILPVAAELDTDKAAVEWGMWRANGH